MRESILSSVDLPAPLRPMMPITSPGRTVNETSSSAQMVLWLLPPPAPPGVERNRRSGAAAAPARVSRRERERSRPPMRYCLPRPSQWMATSLMCSDDVREGLLHPAEVVEPAHQDQDDD